MANYTEVETYERDWWPRGKDTDTRYINAAAKTGAAIIDAKLSKCYAVPFSRATVGTAQLYPPVIVAISDLLTKVLAEYLMEKGRIPKVSEVEDKALVNPFSMLADIVSGDMDVIDANGNRLARLTATGAYVPALQKDYAPIFEVDSELEHEPHEDLLDDIEDARD